MGDSNDSSQSNCQAAGAPKPERTNKIAIYLRSYTIAAQYTDMHEKQLREYVESANRYRPLGEIVKVFKDESMTFGTFSRPGIQALMKAVRRRQVTLVLVPEFRDLASLPRDLFRLLRFFDRHRCGLRSRHEYLLFEDLGGKS